MKLNKREIAIAIACVFSGLNASASLAQTAPSLLAGGSTLVQPLINAEMAMFPVADGTARYFAVGSGAGQSAFLGNSASLLGTGVTGTVDFANSDAPLSPFQITIYQAGNGVQPGRAKTDGPLIQIPYLITPITIALVNVTAGQSGGSAATGPALPNSTTPTVALNDADLCGIFSGGITDWSRVTNPDNGQAYPAGAIKVVYFADNSGETDLLTAHLAKVCSAGTGAVPITFSETQNFASLFPSSTPPSNFTSASGSGGVADLMVSLGKTASNHVISYLSPAFTNTFLAPSSASAAAHQLSVASLRNSTSNVDVVPTFQNAALALGTFVAPTGLAGAPAASPAAWVPNASNPSIGYPISGTSQIILSQCYANHGNTPTVAASVVDFLTQHYSSSNAAMLNGNGFATLPTAFQATLVVDFLTTGRSNTLNIGNATVCGAVTGR